MSRWLPDVLAGPRGKHALKVAEYWWSYQHWYINAATGNDFNDGATAGTSLRTTEELSRRLAVSVPIDHPVTVHIAQGSYGTLAVRVIQAATACPFDVVGDVSYTDIGTVTSYTNRVAATNTEPLLVASGVADWTAHVGKRVDVRDGASVGAVAWVGKVNPHGGGVATAGVSQFAAPSSTSNSPVSKVPSAGSAISIATLPAMVACKIQVSNTGLETVPSSRANRGGSIRGLAISDISVDSTGNFLVEGCSCSTVIAAAAVPGNVGTTVSLSKVLGADRLLSGGAVLRGCLTYYCLFSGVLGILWECIVSSCLSYGMRGLCVGANSNVNGLGVFDVAASDAITINTPFAYVGGCYGRDNAAYGVAVPNTRSLTVSTNYLTGASGDVKAGSSAIPWTALPWRDGERFGEATLVGGTVDVTVPWLLSTQKITACAKTFGGAPGFLSAAYVDATTIRITSSSATDTSTITWHILPVGDNAVIRS